MTRFELLVSYYQFALFHRSAAAPFSHWTEAHTGQGFAWRAESVGFITAEIVPHEVEIAMTSDDVPALGEALWRIEVPFVVPPGERVAIESPGGDAVDLDIAPGRYQLRYECTGEKGGIARIRLVFAPSEDAQFRVLRFDPSISPGPSELLLTADPA